MSPDDHDPAKGSAARAFNQAASKTGHTSREFNRVANVMPAWHSRDVWQNRPSGTGFGPPGQAKQFRKSMDRYGHEQETGKKQRDNVNLRDNFNEKARPRER